MIAQYLEFVRQQLIAATADLSGETKGQLVAFAENAHFTATARSRVRKKVADPVTGRMVNPSNPPIHGQQSRAKGSSIALVLPVEYSTASWRRALLSLKGHQKAWLLWNYSESTCWDHQVIITRWAWGQFSQYLESQRVAKKTMERLRQLIWLAAQDKKAVLAGHEQYQYAELAVLVGVSGKNWSKTFTSHWVAMQRMFSALDRESLLTVIKTRSQQKATNYEQGIAKVD